MAYPKSVLKLIEDFKSLPGVGERTAERYALRILSQQIEDVEQFAEDLKSVKEKVKYCSICGNMTEEDVCEICRDESRDHSTICVVQEPKDIFAFEKTGYKGMYHVLNGVISPSKGILPDHINVPQLLNRLNDSIKEVILATSPTMDGETTALYLTKVLKDKGVEVSRLAHGIPMGQNIDYVDELTLMKAFQGRTKE